MTIDVGILIALKEEFLGTLANLTFRQFFELDGPAGPDHCFSFVDKRGVRHRGVAIVMNAMTPIDAYAATRRMLETYKPRLAANVGISGGLASHVRLGDVVVANEVDDYLYSAKAAALPSGIGGISFELGGRHFSPSPALARHIGSAWEHTPALETEWSRRGRDRQPSGSVAPVEPHVGPSIHCGPIACGPVVIADGALRAILIERNRKVLAVEMESAGFLKACVEAGEDYPRLVLKAVSDFADPSKTELEAATKDEVRAWSMANALDALSMLLRHGDLLPLATATRRAARSTTGSGVRVDSLDQELLRSATQRHIKKQHRALAEDIPRALKLYNSLYSTILDLPPTDTPFQRYADVVANSSSAYPLRVDGGPGTGKTTFLTLLYLALVDRRRASRTAPRAAYLNLRRYLPTSGINTPSHAPDAWLQDDAALVMALVSASDQIPAILILDGIDEYSRHAERYSHQHKAIEDRLLTLIGGATSGKKVIGVGLTTAPVRERLHRDLTHLSDAEHRVTLTPIPTGDARAAAFLDAFREVFTPRPVAPHFAESLLERAAQFRLSHLDVLLASMLAEHLRFSPVDQPNEGDRQRRSVAELFGQYCAAFLSKVSPAETLNDASELAFAYLMRDHDPTDAAQRTRAWKLLHVHPEISNYLVAHHAVRALRAAGVAPQAALSPDLNYVYPHSVNKFYKDIVNLSLDAQDQVLRGAQQVLEHGGELAMPHACYVAGRVDDWDRKQEARTLLKQHCDLLEARPSSTTTTRASLMLMRTLYISRAYLGDSDASEAYIKHLISDPEWNDVNRGFHLEYYGDIPYSPDRLMSHSDRGVPFPHTFFNLQRRVEAHVNDPEYGLFNIEVFTLFSLAQHRHAHRRLDQAVRLSLRALIGTLLISDNLSKTVATYIDMLGNHFEADYFDVGSTAELLYRLKDELRAGWVERGVRIKRTESVAEHVFGAQVLAMLYLPDSAQPGWPSGYSKTTVMEMLLAHDLAEAIVGDVSFSKATEATHESENTAYAYLRQCATYGELSGLAKYAARFDEFDEGVTFNARVARDMDKLDNLMQLYLYDRESHIPDFQAWKARLERSIVTTAGRDVLRALHGRFEGVARRGNPSGGQRTRA